MRLRLLQLGLLPDFGTTQLPGSVIQSGDGTNILIDTGYPRHAREAREQAAVQLLEAYPDDEWVAFNAEVTRYVRDDAEDLVVNRLEVPGSTPADIDYLVCAHFDSDHAGNHDLFPDGHLVVQRHHYEAVPQYPRFRLSDMPWHAPSLRHHLIDGLESSRERRTGRRRSRSAGREEIDNDSGTC